MKKIQIKRIILLFLFLFFAITNITFAQAPTNAQIYNFAIGDVFEITKKKPSACTPYALDQIAIQNKWTSSGLDTVFYSRWIHTVKIAYCFPILNYMDTLVVTNLNLPADFTSPVPPTPCVLDTIIYTMMVANCNKNTWAKTIWNKESGGVCANTPFTSLYLIEGCGGPYYYQSKNNYMSYESYLLTSYSKGTSDTCGTLYPLAIIQLAPEEIVFWPNPSKSLLNWNHEYPSDAFLIYDIFGRVALHGKVTENHIDISSLSSGTYIILLFNKKNKAGNIQFQKVD